MYRNNDINQTHVGHRQSGKHTVNQSRLKKELTFIRAKVSSLQDNMQKALCVIPIITSQKEEEKLIQGCTRVRLCSSSNDRIINSFTLEMLGLNSRKKIIHRNIPLLFIFLFQPAVKLLYNRGNNKYSYTR